MIGKSFRSTGKRLLPRGNPRKLCAILLAGVLAGCGGSAAREQSSKRVLGALAAVRVPADWKLTRKSARSIQAEGDGSLVSVTIFPLATPFRKALWPRVVPQIDRSVRRFASREHSRLTRSETIAIDGHKARAYDLERPDGTKERIAFVLTGRREYQLYCRGDDTDACTQLFASFRTVET
jgi:hypothetical protein